MKQSVLFCFASVLSFLAGAQAKIDSAGLLRQAEMKRMPWKQMSLTARITGNQTTLPGQIYRVALSGNNALVFFEKPEATKGNLLLMRGNDLWIFLKGTKQATKITALQRLSGAVSYADLARLNWSADYRISSVEKVPSAQASGNLVLLHLDALAGENAYRKIDLWINLQNKRPEKEDIYLGSGRLYKTMQFSKFEKTEGKEICTEMILADHFAGNNESVILISGIREEKMFPPSYFEKDSLPEVSVQMMR